MQTSACWPIVLVTPLRPPTARDEPPPDSSPQLSHGPRTIFRLVKGETRPSRLVLLCLVLFLLLLEQIQSLSLPLGPSISCALLAGGPRGNVRSREQDSGPSPPVRCRCRPSHGTPAPCTWWGASRHQAVSNPSRAAPAPPCPISLEGVSDPTGEGLSPADASHKCGVPPVLLPNGTAAQRLHAPSSGSSGLLGSSQNSDTCYLLTRSSVYYEG